MEHGITELTESNQKNLPVFRIDEQQVQNHLGKMVRENVEQFINGLLDAEADELCKASRYERSPERVDTLRFALYLPRWLNVFYTVLPTEFWHDQFFFS